MNHVKIGSANITDKTKLHFFNSNKNEQDPSDTKLKIYKDDQRFLSLSLHAGSSISFSESAR